MKSLQFIAYSLAALAITACTPSYESTTDICATNQNDIVRVAVENFRVTPEEDTDDYVLYLQDILTAYQPDASAVLTDDEQAARTEILDIINKPEFLNYNQSAGVVHSATNALDFLEGLIATSDESRVIEAFRAAKSQIAKGIAYDDGFCSYTNRNIQIENLEENKTYYAELQMSYSPFTGIYQQFVTIAEALDDLSNSTKRAATPYQGFLQAYAEDFKEVGFTTPSILRQAVKNNADLTRILAIDDGHDNKLGQLVYTVTDSFCTDAEDPETPILCASDVATREVAKTPQCSVIDPDNEHSADETGKRATQFFDLNTDLVGLKRVRVEIDYPTASVRIYGSTYNEAILDFDNERILDFSKEIFLDEVSHNILYTGGTILGSYDLDTGKILNETGTDEIGKIIKDPTGCEKQAVLDELIKAKEEANPDSQTGVRLTVVPDPDYDVSYLLDTQGKRVKNEFGEETIIEPSPSIHYLGTPVPARM